VASAGNAIPYTTWVGEGAEQRDVDHCPPVPGSARRPAGRGRRTRSDGASWRISWARTITARRRETRRSPPRHAVRANQATLSVRPDHPVGTIASLVMIAV